MCEPATVAGIALSAASTGAQMMGQRQQEKARRKVMNQYESRQRINEQRSRERFDDSLNAADRDRNTDDMAGAEAERVAEDTAILAKAPPIAQTPVGSAPAEVASANARAMRKAATAGVSRAKRNAAVGAYDDAQNKLGVNLAHNNQWQAIFGGNAQREAAILPAQLELANQKGGLWRGIGAGLGVGGRVVGGLDMGSWSDLFGGSSLYGAADRGFTALGPGGRLVGGV